LKPANTTPLLIGDWRVDPAVDEISREGVVVKLEPRAMRLLLYLAGRAGQVVSVQELLDEVWADVIVTSDSVYQAVAALRRLLGDHAKESAYIVTLPRRGYRLIAPVAPVNEPESAAAVASTNPAIPRPSVELAESSTRRRISWLWPTAITGVALLSLAYALVEKPWTAKSGSAVVVSTPPAISRSIAVLPFVDMSEKKDQEYFADGMAEEVQSLLAKVPGLTVVGRTSSFQFKGKSDDLRTIGTKLNAAFILEGSVRKAGSRVRVTAQLVDATSGTHRWSESYDRNIGDVLALQDEIAMGIARSLQLTVDVETAQSERQLRSADAYALYLHGRAAQDRDPALVESLRDFEQALALDPSFAQAAEAMALSHIQMGFDEDVPPRMAWQKARHAAETALRIEPTLAHARGVLGVVHALEEFDWSAAETEFRKALALNPGDPVTLAYAGRVAHMRGLHDEALRDIRASLAIDPLNPYTHRDLGQMLYSNGDYLGAELEFRKSLAISEKFDGNRWLLTRIMLIRGQIDAALAEAQAEVSADGRDAGLAIVYHAQHRKADSDAALERLIRESAGLWPYGIAVVYGYRGERDKTIEWMQKAVEARDSDIFLGFRGDPEFAFVRGDPRYVAMLNNMKLPN